MQNRVKELRKRAGLTQAQLAEKIGASDHTRIQKLENGKLRLTDNLIMKLSKALKVTPAEILNDPNENPELALSLMGNAARSGDVDELMRHVNARTAAQKKTGRRGDSWNYPPISSITEIDVRGGMGGGGEAELHVDFDGDGNPMLADAPLALWGLPTAYVQGEIGSQPQCIRIIQVMGDSMFPTLWPGDRVAVDLSKRNPTPPGLFALWDGFGVIVKRIERIMGSDPHRLRVISDNAQHQPFELTSEEARIIGRVVWYGRRI